MYPCDMWQDEKRGGSSPTYHQPGWPVGQPGFERSVGLNKALEKKQRSVKWPSTFESSGNPSELVGQRKRLESEMRLESVGAPRAWVIGYARLMAEVDRAKDRSEETHTPPHESESQAPP